MIWYKLLELIEEHTRTTDGAAFAIHQTEACGWYTSYHVYGESDKTYISKDYLDKQDSLEVLAKHLGLLNL